MLNVPCLSGFLFFLFTMPPNFSISCDRERGGIVSLRLISPCSPPAVSQAESGSRRGGLGGMLAGGGFGESADGPELVVNLMALRVSF